MSYIQFITCVGCVSWASRSNVGSPNGFFKQYSSLQGCLSACIDFPSCLAVDVVAPFACFLHNNSDDLLPENIVLNFVGSVQYVLDRLASCETVTSSSPVTSHISPTTASLPTSSATSTTTTTTTPTTTTASTTTTTTTTMTTVSTVPVTTPSSSVTTTFQSTAPTVSGALKHSF